MDEYLELVAHCHVNTNIDGDSFVGVIADPENAMVFFPMGFSLSETEKGLRQDIIRLISVLNEFSSTSESVFQRRYDAKPQHVNFPISSYLEIIFNYLKQNGYYYEKVADYKDGYKGKHDWPKTFRKKRPLIQSNNTPAYIDFIVRVSALNDRNMITQIHKFCVYESFLKLGWLFTPYLPEKPMIKQNYRMFLSVLYEKLERTFIDEDRRLFLSMIKMFEFLDDNIRTRQFFFGTYRFEYIWEKLIDRAFGIRRKVDYFPRTQWKLRKGRKKINIALEPDTIMVYNNNIYVIDAKYYKFGMSNNPEDLPSSSSINKQITYGEYIASQNKFRERHGNNMLVYNAFLMPFAAQKNAFETSDMITNIGEASGDWKTKGLDYERVQGILIDVRYLLYHYIGEPEVQLTNLAQTIEGGFS